MDDAGIWRAARQMIDRYGAEAAAEADERAATMAELGDGEGRAVWRRIAGAVKRLQATAPAPGELVH